jgi:hypothetical protein
MAGPITLEVSPRRVALLRAGGELDARSLGASDAGSAIAGAAAALAVQAAPGPLDVRLASGVARLMLLPWLDQLTTDERWRNYASGRFEQTFGENLEHWDLRIADDLPGRDRLVVAWPRPLREALEPLRHVRSVRLDLLEYLGYLLGYEPSFTGCLAEIRIDGAGLLLLQGGALRRARWRRFDDASDLANAVRSEWVSAVPDAGGARVTLALAPPAPERGSDLEQTVVQLAQALGARHVFTLPFPAGRGPAGTA